MSTQDQSIDDAKQRYTVPLGLKECIIILICLCLMWLPWGFIVAQDRTLVRQKTSITKEKRHALVIGNSDYRSSPLSNPVHDAKDMARVLTELDFEVSLVLNATRRAMKQAIRVFVEGLRRGGVGLFYYAGHGMQVQDQNYLIPVDADITREFEIDLEAISANWVLGGMKEAKNALNMVFLDACRDNPFKQYFRSSQKGLALMQAPRGSLIAYATSPGNTAADGMGRNGTFTKHLLRHIQTPGVTIETVLKQVRLGVSKETKGQQITWQHSSLMGDFFFASSGRVTVAPTIVKPALGEISINSQPSGAKIYINDIYEGQSPLSLFLAPAVVEIRAEKTGYQAAQEKVSIRSNRPLELSLLLEKHWRVGQVFRDELNDGSLGPEMVVVPAGSFRMGDIQGGGDKDEKPVHRVNVKAFAMGKTKVRVAEFRRFIEATGYVTEAEKDAGGVAGCATFNDTKNEWQWTKGKHWRDPGFSQSESHPVVCVSWNDVQRYVNWLKQETGESYRLASEAEWEYAARAGRETKYSFGNESDLLCRYGNVADQRLKEGYPQWKWTVAECRDDYVHTAPVALFKPNAFGLYDVHGNVREWVLDCWNKSYEGAPEDGSVWESGDCGRRVLRGGSWYDGPRFVRSANRNGLTRGYRFTNMGFRLARTF